MNYPTLATMRSKIERDLDLQDELFITATDITSFINEAIDDVEAQVHTLYEDYFLTKTSLALVSGTSDYALPSGIYADKIRRVVYDNGGGIIYEVPRLKDRDGFLEGVFMDRYPTTNYYKYRLRNDSAAAGVKFELHPSARETSSSNITIWYIRNAATLSSDTDVCDIPEFSNYVIQYAKCRCYEKEPGHPNYPAAISERDRLRDLMINTLQDKIPDADNIIEMDTSHYEDMS
jgi:hypothetical protein